MNLPTAFRPLRHPAYRWLATSLGFSILSEGFWVIAIVWQVVELQGGPTDLSLVISATAVGMVLTTLFGGVLADRVPQHRILFGIEAMRAIAVLAVGVLSATQTLDLWHLALVAFLSGVGQGLYYPAYSALLPSIVPERELLQANGMEAMLRPALMQAIGPALAGLVVAVFAPSVALLLTAVFLAAAALSVLRLPAVKLRRDVEESASVRAVGRDLKEGFVYMIKTPWLLATLLFASVMVLVVMGPMEVLTPFVIKDQAGGGPQEHSYVLAAYGIGGVVASFIISSRKMPRRYLTTMNLMWALSCLPFVIYGFSTSVWPIVAAAFVIGGLFNAPMIIWGTLLQRRVPPALLGRVSSLDFFVSILFMPVSMALAGPAAEQFGLQATFIAAGVIPLVVGIAAIVLARLPRDELAHPLRDDDNSIVDVREESRQTV